MVFRMMTRDKGLPPNWGHEPEDGRDLESLLPVQASLSVEEILTDEALLAGLLAGISDSQRPVAGTMFALRAAPAGSELAGEAESTRRVPRAAESRWPNARRE